MADKTVPNTQDDAVGFVEPLAPPSDTATATEMVAMSDGVRLATDIYVPQGPQRSWPTLLIRTCYDKASPLSYQSLPRIADFLVDQGYAVVAQDVRGKGHSEGARYAYIYEMADGYDTIDWISAQKWSDGAVGMFGPSYLGSCQWAAAAARPPALRAIAPEGIAVNAEYPLRNQGVWWMEDARWYVDTWASAQYIPHNSWEWSRPFFGSIPDAVASGREILRDHIWGQTDRAYHLGWIFSNGNVTDHIDIPALHIGAWWDGFAGPQVEDWRRARQGPRGDVQFLELRAADHFADYDPELVPGQPAKENAAHEYWMSDAELMERLPEMMASELAFFDRYVRGNTKRAQFPSVRYQIANADWQTADRWPPVGARQQVLYLADVEAAVGSEDGGALVATPERKTSKVGWTHDPLNPVSSGMEWERVFMAAPPNESVLHGRDDVATFTAAPTKEPVDLVGPIVARLTVGSSAPSGHVMVTLSDVDPEGRALLLTQGASHFVSSRGAVRIGVDMAVTGYRLRPGHRLRLAVSSSSAPRYIVHPGTDEDPWLASDPQPASQYLESGGVHGSALLVTVMDAR